MAGSARCWQSDGVRTALGMTVALLLSCAAPPSPYLRLRIERLGATTRLTLLPAPGARINARLVPALERRGGGVLRFQGSQLTADSSYYTAPPTLELPGDPAGVIRASVCPDRESVCRRVELRVPA
jgi:hypothetical protein